MRVFKTFHTPIACVATAAFAVALLPSPSAEARGKGFGTGLAIGIIGGIVASEMAKEANKKSSKAKSSGEKKSKGAGSKGSGTKVKAVVPGGAPPGGTPGKAVVPGGTPGGSPGMTPGGGRGGNLASSPGGSAPGGSAPGSGGPGGKGPGGDRSVVGGGAGGMAVFAGAFGVMEAGKDVVKLADETDRQRAEAEKRATTAKLEADSNVDDAIAKLVADLQQRQAKAGGKHVSHPMGGGSPGEVTDSVLRMLVADAYKQARLDEFDTLGADAMWSRERLTVFVLRQARLDLDALYADGAKRPGVDSLRELLVNAAREVYTRALETAEIMGVGHSFEKFIGKVYRASTSSDDGLPTVGSDGRYEKMMTAVIDSVAVKTATTGTPETGASLTLDRQFLFRFRARRTLYDCVSASYEGLAKLDSALASVVEGDSKHTGPLEAGSEGETIVSVSSEVWRRVEAHVKDVCRTSVQASVLKAAAEGDLRPTPIRADSYAKSGELSPIPMSLK